MRELLVEVQMRSKQSSILSVGDCRTPIRAKSSLMVINAAAAGLGELVSSVVDGPAVYVVNVMTRNENPVKLKTENRTNRLSRLEGGVVEKRGIVSRPLSSNGPWGRKGNGEKRGVKGGRRRGKCGGEWEGRGRVKRVREEGNLEGKEVKQLQM